MATKKIENILYFLVAKYETMGFGVSLRQLTPDHRASRAIHDCSAFFSFSLLLSFFAHKPNNKQNEHELKKNQKFIVALRL